jgi:hypothetical protein
MRNVAIFTVHDIQQSDARGDLVSTSALEKALEEGYEVFVVNAGENPHSLDRWWLQLVQSDHVITSKNANPGVLEHNELWKTLYLRLGLRYPRTTSQGRDCGDMPWPGAQHELQKHGYRLGASFKERRLIVKRKPGTEKPAAERGNSYGRPRQNPRRPNRAARAAR